MSTRRGRATWVRARPDRCATVFHVSNALLHGLPVLIVIALIVLIYRRGGKGIAPYQLSQPWTNEPILWAAVDEPIPANHDDGTAPTYGGGASGRW